MTESPIFQGLLPTNEAAALVGFKPQTLRRFRSQGIGPKSKKVMGKVLYDRADLQAWTEQEAAKAEQEAQDARAIAATVAKGAA